MNNRQIECFLEAARLLNFTRAAENLILPQPAVSRYISALEEELGVKLFHRKSSRQVVLTEAGKAYYNLFQRVDLELRRTKQSLANAAPALRPYDFLITDDPLVRKLAEESEMIFQAYHFVPRFRTVSNQETVLCCVENGTGVALLDEWCHARYHPHLCCIHVDEYLPVALGRRRDTESSTVELFRECLTEYFRSEDA